MNPSISYFGSICSIMKEFSSMKFSWVVEGRKVKSSNISGVVQLVSNFEQPGNRTCMYWSRGVYFDEEM